MFSKVKPIIIQTPDPKGPFGAKESGEGANLAIPPAIASAVHNAVGIRIFHLPITPEKILEALEKRGNEGRGMS